MSIKVGDWVYRRTIDEKYLVPWRVVAMRGWWIWTECYLQEKLLGGIVIDHARDLFKIPEGLVVGGEEEGRKMNIIAIDQRK